MNLKWFLHPSASNVIMLPPGDSDKQQSVRTNALRVLLVILILHRKKKCFFREEVAEECTVKDSASAQKQQNIKRKIYTKEYGGKAIQITKN